MTTRAEFVQKARAAGLSDDRIKAAMATRRERIGAFDDDAAPVQASPAASVAPAAQAPVSPSPAEPAARRISLGEMAFPAVNAYEAKNGDGASFGRYGAAANDLLSLPKRLWDANVNIAMNKSPNEVIQSMTRTKPAGIVDAVAREAPLMAVPPLKLAGTGAMRIASAVGAGMAEAAPSAAVHQLERKAEGQDFSGKTAAGEMALGGMVRGGLEGIGQGVRKIIPYIKRGVSKLSEVGQDALESVAAPVGGHQNLQQYAEAAKRFGTADGGTDLMPMAEELGAKVDAENAARTNATAAARIGQKSALEQDALGLRNELTGIKAKRIQDISAGDRGEAIKFNIETAKPAMQKAYTEGDKSAYGGLRTAPAATKPVERVGFDTEPTFFPDGQGGLEMGDRQARKVIENVPVLPDKIGEVLGEFKALSPQQGVAKISPAGTKAIKAIQGLAEQAKTVDDLVDLKWQVRHMQATGSYEGALFDATRDDLALAKVMDKIREVEESSIKAAAPKKAAKVMSLVDANNELYGRTIEMLRKGDQRFRLTTNTENIIGKVKALGPEEARALMSEAEGNKVLRPYVGELQKGFVDDLLLSSVKNGEFAPEQLAKEWANVSEDIKQAWLPPETIKKMDAAIARGTKEIADPELVGKALFGSNADKFLAEKKLANITGGAQKKALAELQTLDELFGSAYTHDAVAAYRGKQLQLGETGKLPMVGNIRTGKAAALATTGATMGATAGAALAGPMGAAVGGAAGSGAGLFMQSPSGAVLIFRALNRLEQAGASDATKAAVSQGLRSAGFQPSAKRIP